MTMQQRAIKFKFWNPKEGKWAEFTDPWSGESFIEVLLFDIPYLDLEDHYIPVEYTGLKDRHGKEIYEFDSIKVMDRRSRSFVGSVEMIDGSWRVMDSARNRYWVINALFEYHSIEVVGNIYENPDLLK